MKTKTITVYKYDELSEKAKEKAVNDLLKDGLSWNWEADIYEEAKELGLLINYHDNKAIDGKLHLVPGQVAKNIMNLFPKGEFLYGLAEAFLSDLADALNIKNLEEHEKVLEMLRSNFEDDLLEHYHKRLQDEYNYLTSRECIEETIRANDYEFLEDGTFA